MTPPGKRAGGIRGYFFAPKSSSQIAGVGWGEVEWVESGYRIFQNSGTWLTKAHLLGRQFLNQGNYSWDWKGSGWERPAAIPVWDPLPCSSPQALATRGASSLLLSHFLLGLLSHPAECPCACVPPKPALSFLPHCASTRLIRTCECWMGEDLTWKTNPLGRNELPKALGHTSSGML